MPAPDWLAYWGAGLSSLLAVREVLKHRRATRPKLVGYIVRGRSDGMMLTAGGPEGVTQGTGESIVITVHNRGGAATAILKSQLCIAPQWCPRMLLEPLGELGLAPATRRAETKIALRHTVAASGIDPGKEQEVRVALWEEHRSALEQGRLMLNVVHTWSRDRPQQVPIRRSA